MDILNLDPNMALSLPELEDPFTARTYSVNNDHLAANLFQSSDNDFIDNIQPGNHVDRPDEVGPDIASIEADVSFSNAIRGDQIKIDDMQNNNKVTEEKNFVENESLKERDELIALTPGNDIKSKSESDADLNDKTDIKTILRKKEKPKLPPKPRDDGIDITEIEPGLVLMKRLSKEWRMPVINSKL